jgi:hypothetical protein
MPSLATKATHITLGTLLLEKLAVSVNPNQISTIEELAIEKPKRP